jgi:tripartite-type tricarboxylate transporter receptor subunit TctC
MAADNIDAAPGSAGAAGGKTMHRIGRRRLLGAALGVIPARVLAQAPPALPESARILVGFPPGGALDLIARRLAESLTGRLARAVVVDNRPGAGGRIAVDVARQSPPDGLTLLLNPAGVLTVNPHIYKRLNYDPLKDFAPLGLAAQTDYGIAIGPAVPAEVRTVAAFAAWARAAGPKPAYGSPAAGAPPHFVGDAFSRALGLGLLHAPYRGGVPALNDLMGGQIAALVLTIGDLLPHARAGKLRILGSSGPARSRFAPELATLSEQGVPGVDMRDWFALYIAGQPAEGVVARVAALVGAVTASPDYARQLEAAGLEAASSSPAELDRLARRDLERWGPIVRASGFVADS